MTALKTLGNDASQDVDPSKVVAIEPKSDGNERHIGAANSSHTQHTALSGKRMIGPRSADRKPMGGVGLFDLARVRRIAEARQSSKERIEKYPPIPLLRDTMQQLDEQQDAIQSSSVLQRSIKVGA